MEKINKCFRCGRKAEICLEYVNRCYCKHCYIDLLEQRLRKELRSINFDPNKSYTLLDTPTTWVAELLLKRILKENYKIRIVKKKMRNVLIPISLEEFVNSFLLFLLEGKNPLRAVKDKDRKILKHFSIIEINKLALLLNKKPITLKEDERLRVLKKEFLSHWNSLFAIANSIEKLSGFTKK